MSEWMNERRASKRHRCDRRCSIERFEAEHHKHDWLSGDHAYQCACGLWEAETSFPHALSAMEEERGRWMRMAAEMAAAMHHSSAGICTMNDAEHAVTIRYLAALRGEWDQ